MRTPPTHLLSFNEQIYNFEICSTDFASSLICIASDKKLILGLARFPEESENDTFEWERLKDIYNESRCHSLAFHPETSLMSVPKTVTFCSAGADFILRIFRTDLQNADTVQALKAHTNYVNDIAWDTEGEFLASVSDDHSCKIWSSESHYENVITFCLSSAGMSVKWHPEEPHKVLVAEKKGVVHLYNVRSQQAIISLEAPRGPLMSADWSLNNCHFITALAYGDVVTWDLLHKPCSPSDVKQVHEDGGRCVRFAPNTEMVTASIGRPDITLKVFTAKSPVPLVEAGLKLYAGLCWHHRLPYVAAAYDRKLGFWKVQFK
ncbi:nucleoporin Nup37 [Musca domestica]|uniref:Nucleoporin Nup37 n=1 Tax=Musca domestica TaxID=7370 RepID=A0A1I8MX37_MUSDO|nr:nucleoporin Nup37 [Musca domestica]